MQHKRSIKGIKKNSLFHLSSSVSCRRMEKPYCPECKKEFSRKDVMLRHRQNKHGINSSCDRNKGENSNLHEDGETPSLPHLLPPLMTHRTLETPPPPPQLPTHSPPPPPPPRHALNTRNERAEHVNTPPTKNVERTDNTFILQHPYTGIFSVPTSCGKTFLVKRILQNHKIQPLPERIVWIYKRWQLLYDEIKRTVKPFVEFVQGIPIDIDKDSYLNPVIRNLVILDDVMASSSKDGRITELFTEGSHHRNLSVIAINQNLYFRKDPTQRRNCQYMFLFNNPIDQQQVMTLARQMYPGNTGYFISKFSDAVNKPYGYLLLNLKPTTQDNQRLLSNVFDTEKEDDVISENVTINTSETDHSYQINEDHSAEQTYIDMPSCDDCGVVLDSMHDLQRHIKSWCPENETLKRKLNDTDNNDDDSKKLKWEKYESEIENGDDDEGVENADENEGFKQLLSDAIDAVKPKFDESYDKLVKDGMDEDEALQQGNEDVTRLIKRDFNKRYTNYLKLAVYLQNSDVNETIIERIQSLMDNGITLDTAIKRVLKKSDSYFDDLFDDDYFEMDDKDEATPGDEESSVNDE